MADRLKEEIHKKKQAIERIKQDLREKTSGAIDKFTRTDELLYYLLQEQRRTNDQLELHTKLLYGLYKGGIAAPEGQDIGEIQDVLGSELQTKVHNIDNPQSLGTSQQIFRVEGKGYIQEIKFKSSTSSTDNKLYSIRIKVDDNVVYDGTWTEFEARSLHETDVTAFEDDNNSYYILHFQSFFYIYNFEVELYNNSAEFTQIYIKYHEEK